MWKVDVAKLCYVVLANYELEIEKGREGEKKE
jgi:hypothetical protein